jgi:hypothetical protein
MIATATETGITIITMCNYDKFQKVSKPIEQTNETASRQHRDKRESTEGIILAAAASAREGLENKTQEPLVTPEALVLAAEVTRIAGHDPDFPPPRWCGAAMQISRWLREGWPRDAILAGARAAAARRRGQDPPDSIAYVEKFVAEEVRRQATPLPSTVVSAKTETGGRNGTDWNAGATGGRRGRAGFARAAEAYLQRASGEATSP